MENKMETGSKAFSLGQILSVTHDKLLCPIGKVYDILNHLTQDNLFTHQLPRTCKEVRPHLMASMISQVPGFEEIDDSEITTENWKEWLQGKIEKYGEMFLIAPLPKDVHERKDPISELVEMVGEDKVMVVTI